MRSPCGPSLRTEEVMSNRNVLIVGSSTGIGLELAKALVARGDGVVVTSRDSQMAQSVATRLGPRAQGLALDLSRPESIADQLVEVGPLSGVVLAAIERDANTIRDFNLATAQRMLGIKLVGYAEVIHAVLDRIEPTVDSGIVLFGGRAKDAPYPGSITVSTANGGIDGLMNALALELAPIRVNALHPGIIGDSPFWASRPEAVAGYERRTPGGNLAEMADITDAAQFLLFNRGVSAHSLNVDRGWRVS